MIDDETDPHGLLDVLQRRWILVLAGLVVGVGAALALSFLQQPQYQAYSVLLLSRPNEDQVESEEVATQAAVATSDESAQAALDELGLDESVIEVLETVRVDSSEDTRILTIYALRPDADEAAALANAFASAYVQIRVTRETEEAAQREQSLREQIQVVGDSLAQARAMLARGVGKAYDLQVRVRALRSSLTRLQTRLVVDDDQPESQAVTGRVLSRATPPTSPFSPRPVQAALLGGVMGLIVGVVVALIFDLRRRGSSRSPQERV